MMTNKTILTIIVLLGVSLALPDIGLWAGSSGIPTGTKVQQEKTEKKEEEKKQEEKKKKEEKKEKKLKRVWTDKDLKEIRKERLNITEVSPEPDEKDKKKKEKKKITNPPDLVIDKSKGEKPDPKKTEKYWRERKQALVDKIKANEQAIKDMQAKLFQLQNQLNGTDIVSDRLRFEQEIRDTYNKLENYKKGLERMKQELEDLKDEARRAGALPGWVRD